MILKWLTPLVAAAALGVAGYSAYAATSLQTELANVRSHLAQMRQQVGALELRTRPSGCTRPPGEAVGPQLC
jgi:hypothetical protein